MITQKTLLILGAGASIDYGFPSGELLLDEIITYLDGPDFEKSTKHKIFISLLLFEHKRKIDREYRLPMAYFAIEEFVKSLLNSLPASIDDFVFMVSKYNEDFVFIAKALIVIQVSKYEIEDNSTLTYLSEYPYENRYYGHNKIKRIKRKWYSYLWKQIYTNCSNQDELIMSLCNLVIVSFNYERSLEFFLANRIKSAFNLKDEEIKKILNDNLFVHQVYGKLGDLYIENKINTKNKIENHYAPIITNLEFISNVPNTNDFKAQLYSELTRLEKSMIIVGFQRVSFAPLLDKIIHLAKNIFTYTELIEGSEQHFKEFKKHYRGIDKVFFLGFGYHKQNLQWLKENVFCHFVTTDIWGTTHGFGTSSYLNLVDQINDFYSDDVKRSLVIKGFPRPANTKNTTILSEANTLLRNYLTKEYYDLKIDEFFNEVEPLS